MSRHSWHHPHVAPTSYNSALKMSVRVTPYLRLRTSIEEAAPVLLDSTIGTNVARLTVPPDASMGRSPRIFRFRGAGPYRFRTTTFLGCRAGRASPVYPASATRDRKAAPQPDCTEKQEPATPGGAASP